MSDLQITRSAVLRKGWGNHQEQFIDQHAQEDRRNVPADVICVAAGEVASDSGDEEASTATTDSGDSSTDQEIPLEGSSSSPLAEDLEQYELMKAAYLKVGQDFDAQEELLGKDMTSSCDWKRFLVDGRLPGFRFHYRELLITLIVWLQAAAGRFL